MKYPFKHFLSAFFALSFCSSLFANTTHTNTLFPPSRTGFSAGIEALYLKPTDNNTEYAFAGVQLLNSLAVEDTVTNQTERAIDPTSDWGFRIDLAYAFPCTKYDITAAYTQLDLTSTDSIEVPPNNVINAGSGVTGPFVVLEPLNQLIVSAAEPLFGSATSQVEYNLKAVDLDLGQHFVGCNYDLRLFGGLRYAKLDRDLQATGFPPIPTPEHTSSIISPGLQDMKSHFKGVGPHFGAKGRYGFCRGFALDADVEAALLVGQVDSSAKAQVSYVFTNSDSTAFIENLDYFTQHSENRTVGALEGKLGVDYTYAFGCRCQSALVVGVGYQASVYYDAIENQGINYFAQQAAGVASNQQITVPADTDNLAFNGPYLSVKYCA